LAERVKSGGVFIFTTHGIETVRKLMPDVRLQNGFWFAPHSDQLDLATNQYGTTVCEFDFVYREIKSVPGTALVKYHEGFWWKHQDVYVIRLRATASAE
jgi:hypothetical protein